MSRSRLDSGSRKKVSDGKKIPPFGVVTNCHVTVCHYTKIGKRRQGKTAILNGMKTENFMMGIKRKSPVRKLVPGRGKGLIRRRSSSAAWSSVWRG
jgi:hypothetical protein